VSPAGGGRGWKCNVGVILIEVTGWKSFIHLRQRRIMMGCRNILQNHSRAKSSQHIDITEYSVTLPITNPQNGLFIVGIIYIKAGTLGYERDGLSTS
jgi:hypothetical protein